MSLNDAREIAEKYVREVAVPVSDPTYRIDVSHDPSGPDGFTWTAEVYRLSDDSLVAVKTGESRDEVGERAVQAVYQLTHEQQPPFTVYVDDDGMPVVLTREEVAT